MAAMISSRRAETGSDSGKSMRSEGEEGVEVVKGSGGSISPVANGQTVDYRRPPPMLQRAHSGAVFGDARRK